jgi:phosphoglycolate phosphatase
LEIKTRLVIFDFDGTLVNSYEKVLKVLKIIKKEKNIQNLNISKLKQYFGIGGTKLIKEVFSIKNNSYAENLLKDFRKNYLKLKIKKKFIVSNSVSVLKKLKKNKIKIALCTNKPRNLCISELKGLNLKQYFNCIVCSDDLGVKKPDIKMLKTINQKFKLKKSSCIYVGDSFEDAQLCKNYNIKFLIIKNALNNKILKKLNGKPNIFNILNLKDIFKFL